MNDRGNPKRFERQDWVWTSRRFVPIQMVYGTVQSHCLCYSAKQAWTEFTTCTRQTKEQLMADGYRVKRVKLLPDWKKQ